jgi:hypothetical protein
MKAKWVLGNYGIHYLMAGKFQLASISWSNGGYVARLFYGVNLTNEPLKIEECKSLVVSKCLELARMIIEQCEED